MSQPHFTRGAVAAVENEEALTAALVTMTTTTRSSRAGRPEPRVRRGWYWFNFVARRVVRLIISVFILVSATFVMVHLIPGDPVRAALGDQAVPELVTLQNHELGLDKPLGIQYLDYFKNVAHGDLGKSIVSHDEVSSLLRTRLPNTLGIALPAFVIMIAISLPLGFVLALRTRGGRGERARSIFVGTTGVLNSIPEFVLATILSAIVAVWLELLPVAGKGGLSSYVLPVTALVIGPTATLSRIVRVEALKVLDADYIRSARARRLPNRLLYVRHVLPNMATASLTYGGLLLGNLVAGTILVENVFGWPGLGTVVAQAVVQKDYPVIQGVLLVMGGIVLIINMSVDLILGVLDPRSRIKEG
jgi:peptide/nickel transport system permease protein